MTVVFNPQTEIMLLKQQVLQLTKNQESTLNTLASLNRSIEIIASILERR